MSHQQYLQDRSPFPHGPSRDEAPLSGRRLGRRAKRKPKKAQSTDVAQAATTAEPPSSTRPQLPLSGPTTHHHAGRHYEYAGVGPASQGASQPGAATEIHRPIQHELHAIQQYLVENVGLKLDRIDARVTSMEQQLISQHTMTELGQRVEGLTTRIEESEGAMLNVLREAIQSDGLEDDHLLPNVTADIEVGGSNMAVGMPEPQFGDEGMQYSVSEFQ